MAMIGNEIVAKIVATAFSNGGRIDSASIRKIAGMNPEIVIASLNEHLEARSIFFKQAGDAFFLRTRPSIDAETPDDNALNLSKATMDTLAVIAAFSHTTGVTRSEIERIRGVSLSPGIMETLLNREFIRPGRRRDTPGRPLTWVVSDVFLLNFDLALTGQGSIAEDIQKLSSHLFLTKQEEK